MLCIEIRIQTGCMPYFVIFILVLLMPYTSAWVGGVVLGQAYAAQGKKLVCENCGRIIAPGSNYIKDSDNVIYCSDKCFQATLPVCSVCGEKAAQAVVIRGIAERIFCLRCASRPRCFCCTMPSDCSKLDDGRFVCRECAKTAVTSEARMRELAEEVRTLMKAKLGIGTSHAINFRLVDVNTLGERTKTEQDVTEFGTYLYEELTETTITTTKGVAGNVIGRNKDEKVTRTHTIYLLFSTPMDKMIEVIAHELTHDWQQDVYPNIDNLKVKEGLAEYVAALVNMLYGREVMNKRMQDNPSELYGDGYRMIYAVAAKGTATLNGFLEKCNTKSKTNTR